MKLMIYNTSLTTLTHNELTDFFIMMDCTVVQDNNTPWAREGAKLWGLEY